MVEATESCDINRGKYAKRGNVHKIRKINFVDLYHNYRDIWIREAIRSGFSERDDSEEFSIIRQSRNFACKTARWGRVMFFHQQKTSLLP
jgi:hypothetical protein